MKYGFVLAMLEQSMHNTILPSSFPYLINNLSNKTSGVFFLHVYLKPKRHIFYNHCVILGSCLSWFCYSCRKKIVHTFHISNAVSAPNKYPHRFLSKKRNNYNNYFWHDAKYFRFIFNAVALVKLRLFFFCGWIGYIETTYLFLIHNALKQIL